LTTWTAHRGFVAVPVVAGVRASGAGAEAAAAAAQVAQHDAARRRRRA